MRLIPRVSLRSVLRAAPACSSGAVFSEQERMEHWNSREGVGNRDAVSLRGIQSSGLLSILIASWFPSPERRIVVNTNRVPVSVSSENPKKRQKSSLGTTRNNHLILPSYPS